MDHLVVELYWCQLAFRSSRWEAGSILGRCIYPGTTSWGRGVAEAQEALTYINTLPANQSPHTQKGPASRACWPITSCVHSQVPPLMPVTNQSQSHTARSRLLCLLFNQSLQQSSQSMHSGIYCRDVCRCKLGRRWVPDRRNLVGGHPIGSDVCLVGGALYRTHPPGSSLCGEVWQSGRGLEGGRVLWCIHDRLSPWHWMCTEDLTWEVSVWRKLLPFTAFTTSAQDKGGLTFTTSDQQCVR